MLAVIALVFIYMVTKGEAPPIVIVGSVRGYGYMSPENLWREAIVIGGITWILLWIMSASLFFFARDEAADILSILEPIRGMIPTGIMSVFFGLLASLTKGHAWVYAGLVMLILCTLAGLIISLRKLPQLSLLKDADTEFVSPERWRFGFFYVCGEDHRILVPRRSGGGINLNLAHGRAWGILITGFVLPIVIAAIASFSG
ncbi:MAG: hypothetical protein LBH03_01845 [Holophagales bacterium]|nr:hypothetical protein [Holophagales bacterium]